MPNPDPLPFWHHDPSDMTKEATLKAWWVCCQDQGGARPGELGPSRHTPRLQPHASPSPHHPHLQNSWLAGPPILYLGMIKYFT